MIELQLLTGMRPGEVVRLRPADIDSSGPVWVYRPPYHKNAHKGKSRAVAIDPRAQALLKPFTPADAAAYYFNPRAEVERLHAERTKQRKTPRYPSHMIRNAAKRVTEWKRPPAERYTSHSYAVAITRAVARANRAHPDRPPVPEWAPNQLRHTHATEVRKRYGIEAAGAALGHDQLSTTEIYAEKNLQLVLKVAAESG
jgi:integrase